MCSYSFTVFLSAFQLLPTAPFHILSLGGSTTEAGLFLGFLTYASAISAPITGAIGDRFGKRRVLIIASLAITVFSLLYAIAPSYQVILALVLVHGVFWSGCCRARARTSSTSCRSRAGPKAWAMPALPASWPWRWRRGSACGCSITAAGGCCASKTAALNVMMAFIAWRLPPDRRAAAARSLHPSDLVEWRILVGAVTLFLYSFSYGGITSFVAVYAESGRRDAAGAVLHRVLPDDRARRGRSSAATPIASATRA